MSSDVIREVLSTARRELGVRESPSNWGPKVRSYLASTHISFPASWCAAYVWWCIAETAARLKMPSLTAAFRGITPRNFAYCPYVLAWARREGILRTTPAPGDFFLSLRGSGSARHIGFVTATGPGWFDTLEGNSNSSGSPEGTSVCANRRQASGRYAFVRWADLLPDAAGAAAVTRRLLLSGRHLLDMPVVDGRCLCPVRPWGEALGFQVHFEDEELYYNGREVDVDLTPIEDRMHAPIRQLAHAAGLTLRMEPDGSVWVGRPAA